MSQAVQRFYGSNAGVYDRLARYVPGVRRWRETAVSQLQLSEGDTVIDMGCGTGASLPLLRDAVGTSGTVVGVDLTHPLLERAAARAAAWDNVNVVAGDGTTPPVHDSVDGILGCFVVGMFESPSEVIDSWASHLGPGGRIALLDGVSVGWAPPLDRVFESFVQWGTPPPRRTDALEQLTRRIETAHGLLTLRGTAPSQDHFALGYIQVTAATAPVGNSS